MSRGSLSYAGRGTAPSPGAGVDAYVAAVAPLHAALNRVLMQVAGLSLIVMARRAATMTMDAPLVMARDAHRSLGDALAAQAVPARAAHHYRHMRAASRALQGVFDLVDRCLCLAAGDADRSDLVRGLQDALRHLRAAAKLLPGFEMVDLRQACCAGAHQAAGLVCE